MSITAIQFLAVVLTALALAPGGANIIELSRKLRLPKEPYYALQAVYRGWDLFAVVLVAALATNLARTVMAAGEGTPFHFAIAATLLAGAALTIFLAVTLPADLATDNWKSVTPDWQKHRDRWEYSHAANAVLLFLALCAATLSILSAAAPCS
jgi:hypothetical protein